MNAVLVRVGIDQTKVSGHWNSPADEKSGRFVYVPIREEEGVQLPDYERHYEDLIPHLNRFAAGYNLDLWHDLGFPAGLEAESMHLDPDFEYLTYGDKGDRRGSNLRELKKGDLVVFYAAFNSIHELFVPKSLIYAIIGLFVVEKVVSANSVPEERRDENAHTRRNVVRDADIIVRGIKIKGKSGQLKKFLPIGGYRKHAYRVNEDILDAWGGLEVKDGYIQRSGTLFKFHDAKKFYKWFQKQKPRLVQKNNLI